jgi:predicted nucleic acid-binding protein
MNKSEVFIDTNIFLRALVGDQVKQAKECVEFLQKVADGKVQAVTSSLVLAEVAWTLKSYYRLEKIQIVPALEAIQSLASLKIVDEHRPTRGTDLYANHSVKFIDALIASNPRIESGKMAIVSYDKDFDRLGCKRIEPSEF